MVAPARKTYITPEEYLRQESEADAKSEYWDGVLVAMSGGKKEHERISGDFYTALSIRLAGTSCEPFTSGQSVHIPTHNRYVYPDVAVACEAQFVGLDGIDVLTNPILVVEVLSESTAKTDLTTKRDGYFTLPSLAAYVVVSPDTPRIEVLTPLQNGAWKSEVVMGLAVTLSLPAIGCELPLSEIYRRVKFS